MTDVQPSEYLCCTVCYPTMTLGTPAGLVIVAALKLESKIYDRSPIQNSRLESACIVRLGSFVRCRGWKAIVLATGAPPGSMPQPVTSTSHQGTYH